MVDEQKRAAAEAAVARIEDGMIVGLGSGSTAELAVKALGRRARAGLHVTGIPSSERTAALARAEGIALTTLDEQPVIDLTVDGADEVELGTLNLTKGLGGALLREKIVASSSRQLLIMVDSGKLVERLGTRAPIPVEVVPFGWRSTAGRLEALGARVVKRDFVTDGGNWILDCWFDGGVNAGELVARLDGTVGVVEHGLFVGMTKAVFVSGEKVLE